MTKRFIMLILVLQATLATATTTSDWVFKRANSCLNPDNIDRVAANGECLAIQTYTSSTATKPNPTLLIFIHGDGIPGGGPSDYLKYQATKFSTPGMCQGN